MRTTLPTQPLPLSKFKIISGLLLAGVVLFSATKISAQTSPYSLEEGANSISLTAIPPRYGENFDLKMKPGETYQISLRVRNSSDQSMAIQTIAKDFLLSEDNSTPVPIQENVPNRWSLAKWMTISPTMQTLAPNATGNVNVVIQVPADALPGGHYAMVTHEPAPKTGESAGSQTSIGQRVGTLIYGIVEGPINEDALIRNLQFNKFSEYGPVPFGLVVENLSDIHIRPRISVEIYNWFGRKVDTLTLEPKNVFPLTSRDFSGEWNRKYGIGLYTAKVLMSYGENGRIAQAQTTFWLFPITIALASLLVLGLILGIVLIFWRFLNRRMTNDKKRVKELEKKLQELETDHR